MPAPPAPRSSGRRGADAFIASRAAFASARLSTRHPGIAGLLRRSRWPRWLGVALPLLALVAGFVANEFGTGKRLDLLAVPLLGTIAWNLLVYLWLVVAVFGAQDARWPDPLYRALAPARGFGSRPTASTDGTALHRAANAFESRWAAASAPLTSARIARTLHLGAALFAAGLIGGIYLRALVIEYRAGWESTFLGPRGGARPAVDRAWPGELGDRRGASRRCEGIAAMRWTGPSTGGVNAAPWIHLLHRHAWSGLVIVPRLLLACGRVREPCACRGAFPVAGPRGFLRPPPAAQRRRRAAARRGSRRTPIGPARRPGGGLPRRCAARWATGRRSASTSRSTMASEDRWLAAHAGDPDDDYHILLFTLSATPEEENHGALAAALAARIARERRGTVLAAIVDETPFRAHFAGQAGLEERIAGRLAAWRKVLAGAGWRRSVVDLSQDVDDRLGAADRERPAARRSDARMSELEAPPGSGTTVNLSLISTPMRARRRSRAPCSAATSARCAMPRM